MLRISRKPRVSASELQVRVCSFPAIAAFAFFFALLLFFTGGLGAQTPFWPMIGYDAAHTNFNAAETWLHPPFPVEITYPLGPSIYGLASSEGTIFANCREDTNELRTLDVQTGMIPWTFTIPGTGGSAGCVPAIWDTLAYVGGQHCTHLYCLHAGTGAVIWSHPTASLYARSPVIDDGMVFLNTPDSLLCLNALTGTTIWAKHSEFQPVPAVRDGVIYAALSSDSLHALDKFTGATIWTVDAPIDLGVIVAGESLVYMKSYDNLVSARRISDGSEAWTHTFVDEKTAYLAEGILAYAYGKLYVSVWEDIDQRGKIYALDGTDGHTLWVHVLGSYGAFAPVVADDVVYISCWSNDILYAFDASTGDSLNAIPDLAQFYIVSEGSLIATDHEDIIHIFRMDPLGIDDPFQSGPLPRAGFSLAQNFPNPFNPHTTISFDLADRTRVTLTVHDLRGRFITTLIDGETKDAGHYEVVWDGKDERDSDVPSGIYFARFTAATRAATQKMVLLR